MRVYCIPHWRLNTPLKGEERLVEKALNAPWSGASARAARNISSALPSAPRVLWRKWAKLPRREGSYGSMRIAASYLERVATGAGWMKKGEEGVGGWLNVSRQ